MLDRGLHEVHEGRCVFARAVTVTTVAHTNYYKSGINCYTFGINCYTSGRTCYNDDKNCFTTGGTNG